MAEPPGTSTPVAPRGEPEGRFRGFAGMRTFTLGDGRELVVSQVTGASAVVFTADLKLLADCRAFAPLDEHARRMGGELGLAPEQLGPIRSRLGQLAGAGLLVPFAHVESVLRGAAGGDPARVEVIGIPTRDRPDLLARCLADLTEAAMAHGRTFEVVVADDSTGADTRAANRALLRDLRGTFPGELRYAGPDDRARFAATLAGAGCDPRAARFALVDDAGYPVATGTNRNLLMLHAAGRLLLQVDDDVRSRVASVPGAKTGFVLSSRSDPTEFWFPTDAAPDLGPPAELAGVHEMMLGRGVGACAAGVPVHADEAGAGLVTRLGTTGGRVRVTVAGVCGDSGMGSPVHFLLLHGPGRDRLHRTEATYRAALARCRVLRGVDRPTVGDDGTICMGLNLGLDLRTPLPPFMPVLRNQDGVFGAVVRWCCPGAFFGHLPAAVWHLPAGGRAYPPDALDRAAAGPPPDHLLLHLIRAHAPRTPAPDDRRNLRGLGEALGGLADLSPRAFRDVVRMAAREWAVGFATQLAGVLRTYSGEPAWWAADVRRVADRVRTAMTGEHFGTPVDLGSGGDPETGFARFRELVGSFGRLVYHWYDLMDAAADLRRRGLPAAGPV
ncbi:MAG: hypothetical protein JWO38_157 [Gemmataceae bacterium]|nr:hypothetical protein [Gemmataceae bacterium]